MPALRRGDIVAALAATVGLATIAVGMTLRATGRDLGVPLPPFLMRWGPSIDPLAALAAPLPVLAVLLAPRLLRTSPRVFAAATFALALVLRMACAAAGDGAAGWMRPFDPARSFEAKNEYLAALGALSYGPRFFLDRFAELVPSLPVHAAGHPPGLLLSIDALDATTPARLAALCLTTGALAAPLTWAVGRRVLDEPRARAAALLVAFSPLMLLFGAASADALYATLGLLAAWALLWSRTAGAAMLAVASFFSWSLLAVGAWATIVVARREGLRRAVTLATVCGVGLVAAYAALAAATGYDPIGAFRSTEHVYRLGIGSTRPYWFWLFGSPVAFAVMLGLPIAAWALRARDATALALAVVVLTSTVGGFTKAETERIWLFLAPFACLAAASSLPRARLTPVLAALVLQAIAVELLFDTVW